MAGASIEATLELWVSRLRDVKARLRPLFQQERMAASAGLFLAGLLGEERRKTGWMRAEAVGDPGPWRQQAVLERASWDADALRHLGETGGVGRMRTRKRLAAPPRLSQTRIREVWATCPYPADPSYLLDLIESIERGRIDPERPPWRCPRPLSPMANRRPVLDVEASH